MRLGRALLLPLLTLVAAPDAAPPARRSPPVAAPNDNRAPAGSLRDGVLTLSLEATLATWHPDGESLPGIVIEAFAEPGRSPQVPGPLVRVPRGTEVRATVRNALADTLTFHLPAVTGSASDSVTIPPGATGELRARAAMPGTFLYRAVTRDPICARAARRRPARWRGGGGGLVGALLVHEHAPRERPDTTPEDVVFVFKTARTGGLDGEGMPRDVPVPVEINGRTDPDTVVLRAGHRYRLRLIGLQTGRPSTTAWLTARPDSSFLNLRDTMVARWRPVAKDGADLPEAARAPRLARQIVSMGETYDFAYIPEHRGHLRLEVRAAGARGRLLARTPLRVE